LKGTWDDDRDPLAALRRGDPALFEAFVERESASLHRFFLRLGAGRQEAEDLVQEVFLKLYRSAPGYDARSAFGAYALRVARNAWIDRRRRRGVRPEGRSLDELDPAGEGGDPYATAELEAAAREDGYRYPVFPYVYPPFAVMLLSWSQLLDARQALGDVPCASHATGMEGP
jgi:DNA-directed RNA polymerase specialized sigma24 family protein